MGWGTGNLGGGSGGLNLKVVGGTTEPTNPKENMIWVNTDTEITEWVFAAENPYIRTSEDLYTSEGSKPGYYLNTSGQEVTSTDYTNFKEITGNIMLPEGAISVTVVSGSTETSTVGHGFYGADGNLISVVSRKAGKAAYDVPVGAVSIRISVRNDDPGSLFATYMDAEAGAVWILTGTSSPAEFNALKKNRLQVYPLSAKQYQSGAFVDVTAKGYQGGVWVDWVTYLYNKGNEYTDLTGGFTSVKATTQDGYTKGTMTKNSESIKLSCSAAQVVGAVTSKKIPIKGKNTVEINVLSISDGVASLRVSNDNVLYGNNVATQDFSEPGIVSLAVETLDGEYYVGVRCVAGSGKTQTVEFDMLRMK